MQKQYGLLIPEPFSPFYPLDNLGVTKGFSRLFLRLFVIVVYAYEICECRHIHTVALMEVRGLTGVCSLPPSDMGLGRELS